MKKKFDTLVYPCIKQARAALDEIIIDIFKKHDNFIVSCNGASDTPIIFYDMVNIEPYTLDAITYLKDENAIIFEGSCCDVAVDIRNKNMDIEYYASVVWWIIENEDALFSGELSYDIDDVSPYDEE